ncbi:MAG: hypothetical protein A2086_09285 [Spirochaetes bacterium GWD1_27_9]|nr:MAG: hypothetical protein A2Z98_02425 [Spirochaetes bacterium GWB1_27_13]OHD30994.1 MAG: hypothetical protein A2086_09285 [Spirochaetes bacterium GWD1_27_9]
MNSLKGKVDKIQKHDYINQIRVDANGIYFNIITLQLPEGTNEGSEVTLIFKEAEIIITKDFGCFIGVENIIPSKVTNLKIGEVFCEVTLHSQCGDIKAIITTNSFRKIKIYIGERVYALIKANEIGLGGVE